MAGRGDCLGEVASGIQEVRLGIHEAIAETPACEVVAIGGPLQLPTDGSGPSLDWWSWQLVLYDALGEMVADRDETETERRAAPDRLRDLQPAAPRCSEPRHHRGRLGLPGSSPVASSST